MTKPDEEERNYIQRLRRRVTIGLIPWNLFMFDLGVSLVIFYFGNKWAGLLVGIGTWFASWRIVKLDPHPIRAMHLWWSAGRHSYDAGNRHYFRAKEDSWFRYANTARRFYAHVTSRT
jgi:hypothetical protein